MPDRWETQKLVCEGGLIENLDLLAQAEQQPGSARTSINYEPGLKGGYRRITGYSKFDSAAVPGTGPVLGAFVFNGGVVAQRGSDIYNSSGAGWTKISSDTRAGVSHVLHTQYAISANTIIVVDGVNKPAKYQPSGIGYRVLSDAPAAAVAAANFHQHLFLAVGQSVIFSEPTNDEGYDATLGAGEINVGATIRNMAQFRDELYLFSDFQIDKITGDSLFNFQLVPVTRDLGISAALSLQEIGGNLIFLSPDGIRPVSGTNRIGDVELSSISRPIQTRVSAMPGLYGSGIVSCIVRSKSQYRLFGNTSSVPDDQGFGILGGIRQGSSGEAGFEWSQMLGIRPYCCDSNYIGPDEYVIHGGYDGYVYRQEVGDDFDGATVTSEYGTPHLTLNDPTIRKTLQKIDVYMDIEGSGSSNLSVQTILDYDDPNVLQPPETVLTAINAVSPPKFDDGHLFNDGTLFPTIIAPVFRSNLVGSGKTAAFLFTANDNNPPHSIRSFVVQYSKGGRR